MDCRPLPVLIAIMLLPASACAVSIGAGPSTIDYGRLVKGGYAEETITVSTSGGEDLSCTIEFTGDIKDWLSTDRGTAFTLPANSRADVKAIIQPPEDAANGKYTGAIYIKAAPTTQVTSGAGLAVGAGIKIKVSAEVTGIEDTALNIKELKAYDTEVGYPIKITLLALNTGNVRITPNYTTDIKNQQGNILLSSEYVGPSLTPTKVEETAFTTGSGSLKEGQYTLELNIYGNDRLLASQKTTFSMLPAGSLSISGKLLALTVQPNKILAEEPAKVVATFKNTGEGPLQAKLKAESYLNDKLAEIIPESEEMEVQPGGTTTLETYYSPKKPGNYIVRGYVIYRGAKTETKGAILLVEGETDYTQYGLVIIIVLLVYIAYKKATNRPPSERATPRRQPMQTQQWQNSAEPVWEPPKAQGFRFKNEPAKQEKTEDQDARGPSDL